MSREMRKRSKTNSMEVSRDHAGGKGMGVGENSTQTRRRVTYTSKAPYIASVRCCQIGEPRLSV